MPFPYPYICHLKARHLEQPCLTCRALSVVAGRQPEREREREGAGGRGRDGQARRSRPSYPMAFDATGAPWRWPSHPMPSHGCTAGPTGAEVAWAQRLALTGGAGAERQWQRPKGLVPGGGADGDGDGGRTAQPCACDLPPPVAVGRRGMQPASHHIARLQPVRFLDTRAMAIGLVSLPPPTLALPTSCTRRLLGLRLRR